MAVSSIFIPSASVESLRITLASDGVADPTTLPVETCVSADAVLRYGPAPEDGWQAAGWTPDGKVATHVLSDLAPGEYGLWVRILSGDELTVLWVTRLEIT